MSNLTEDELDLIDEIGGLLPRMDIQNENVLAEAALYVHGLQRIIMSKAAARANPDRLHPV